MIYFIIGFILILIGFLFHVRQWAKRYVRIAKRDREYAKYLMKKDLNSIFGVKIGKYKKINKTVSTTKTQFVKWDMRGSE